MAPPGDLEVGWSTACTVRDVLSQDAWRRCREGEWLPHCLLPLVVLSGPEVATACFPMGLCVLVALPRSSA